MATTLGTTTAPALAPPMTPEAIARYQARALAAQDAELTAGTDRKILAIGAGVGLSIGLTVLMSARAPGVRSAGAALAGAGAIAGLGAFVSHVRTRTHLEQKLAYANALASVGATSPGIVIAKGTTGS